MIQFERMVAKYFTGNFQGQRPTSLRGRGTVYNVRWNNRQTTNQRPVPRGKEGLRVDWNNRQITNQHQFREEKEG